MDEEQLEKDRQTKKMKKKDVGDEIDMDDEDDDISEENFGDVEDDIEQTFVPNIKDEQKSQEELMDDYIYENSDGKLVYDIEWDEGFFLRTFPHVFTCKDFNDRGGDITFLPKEDRPRMDMWYK